MTDAAPKRRAGRGTLHIIAGLLIASGVIRIGVSANSALANSSPEITEVTPAQEVFDGPEETGTLLAALKAREVRLEERETLMSDRMQALRVAEAEIAEKLSQLTEVEAKLSATIALADTAAESDLGRLTVVYENMKPKDAAALFEEMTPDFAAGFLGLMRPEAAALVMTELAPETAYSFSVVLAGRNALVPTE